MKKRILFIFIMGLLVFSATAADFTKDGRPSYEYLKSVTVVIRGSGFKETKRKTVGHHKLVKWLGTGVIINKIDGSTYILTNTHVVSKPKLKFVDITVDGIVGQAPLKLPATIVKIHPTKELAIIKVNYPLFNKQKIKGVAYGHIQEKVYLVGHHLGRLFIYGEGVFAGYDGVNALVQIPTLFGDSGSGVFNKEGKLVALNYAINGFGFSYDCSHGIAVDSYYVINFIKDYINK